MRVGERGNEGTSYGPVPTFRSPRPGTRGVAQRASSSGRTEVMSFVEQKRDSADEPQNADTASALPHDDDDDLSVGSHGADGDREPSFVHARGKPAA
ncbi:unnamed protein product [Lampetra fluviatilis]